MSVQIKNHVIRDYTAITIGAMLMALGIGVFLVDAKVVPGGVSGLSMAIHYMSGNTIPVGLMIWLLNIPLYFWGWRVLGSRFGARTFYGFSVNSFFIDFFRGSVPGFHFMDLQNLPSIIDLRENDFFFLILLGAVFLGIGLGIVFKFKGTTAGSDIVAAILQHKYGTKPGQAIMMADFFVIVIAGLVLEWKGLADVRPALSLTLYAFFLLFVTARLIDLIIDGFDYARSALIISDEHEEIAAEIMNRLSRGATAVKGRGLYRDVDREILLTIVPLKEVTLLVDIIKSIDPAAFVTISNVHEVLGEGFRRRI